MKKRIVCFNGYYYPSKNCGGPVASVENIVNACHDEFDFYIVCYNHDFGTREEYDLPTRKWMTYGHAQVMYVDHHYIDYSYSGMTKFLKELKPDMMWFSGVLNPNKKIVGAYCGRKLNIPVLYSPRGEVGKNAVILKGYKKFPYLFLLKLLGVYKGCFFHGTSDDEIAGIKRFFNPDSQHIFKVRNIPILPQVNKAHAKEAGSLKVIFFSRIHSLKNLLFAIQCLCNCKSKIEYDIYGPIESEDYWKECEECIKTAPGNITVRYRGILEREKLSATVQEYDCLLLPTTSENYGQVIAETLANSRPVVISKGTTPWDALDGKAGFTISLDEPDVFTEKLDYLASLDNNQYNNLIESTSEFFKQRMKEDAAITGHKAMFNSIINSRRK